MNPFDTVELSSLVDNLPRPSSFLLDTAFPVMQTHESEDIAFDIRDGARRIAPFVSPLVGGKIVEGRGYRTERFQPAYVKIKSVLDTARPLKRAMGETIGGSLAPNERLQAILADQLAEHVDMINRRLEVMASEVLRTGRVTVSGEKYPTQVVDFGRHSDHTASLLEAVQWDVTDVDPAGDLETWSLAMLQRAGQAPDRVIMDIDAWKFFIKNPTVAARLDVRNLSAGTLNTTLPATVGASLMGTLDGRAIYVYADWYVDPEDNTEKPILPSGTVILLAPRFQGVRAFGAIRDHSAGFIAQPYHSKSWVDEDPSVRYLLTQSAPLLIPSVPNASFCATVL